MCARSSSATRDPVTPSRTWGCAMLPPIPFTASLCRVVRVPQQHLGVLLVRFAVREAHQLELHAPGAEKVHPSLAGAGIATGRRFAQYPNTLGAKVIDGSVEILDVKRQVMAADIAVARNGRLGVGRLVLEHLEIGARAAPVEAQLAHHGARVDVEMLAHPV